MTTSTTHLDDIETIFDDIILGRMISDLRKAIKAEADALVILGCFAYTEAIGAFLPLVDDAPIGGPKEQRFYRCLFRLPSSQLLREQDALMRRETKSDKGIYRHLRHTGAHNYFFHIKRWSDDGFLFYPVTVTRFGKDPLGGNASPMGLDANDGSFCIAATNYVDELEEACKEFRDNILVYKEADWLRSAEVGRKFLMRGENWTRR